jgi:hypothetical protein
MVEGFPQGILSHGACHARKVGGSETVVEKSEKVQSNLEHY